MTALILHPTAQLAIDRLQQALPQSLLISGQEGIGLLTIAKHIAGTHLAAKLSPRDSKGNIDRRGGTITVEEIRRLYEQTRAKHITRHIIILDDADRMSVGAQSAFLKLLEEPNEHIHFILTSHYIQKLLPTIHSRVQHTSLQPLSPSQSASFINSLNVSDTIKSSQLQFMAHGLPAEIVRLVHDERYFQERAAIIGDARDLLQGKTYAKLLIIQKYRSNREDARLLIDSAVNILRRSISAKPQPGLVTQLEQLLTVGEHIANNYSIQLQLARFVL